MILFIVFIISYILFVFHLDKLLFNFYNLIIYIDNYKEKTKKEILDYILNDKKLIEQLKRTSYLFLIIFICLIFYLL